MTTDQIPEAYQGKHYVAVYAAHKGEGKWGYELVLHSNEYDFLLELQLRAQRNEGRCIGAFPRVNTSFWNAAEEKIKELNSKEGVWFIQNVGLQDILEKVDA
jgi:hypothetical protein